MHLIVDQKVFGSISHRAGIFFSGLTGTNVNPTSKMGTWGFSRGTKIVRIGAGIPV